MRRPLAFLLALVLLLQSGLVGSGVACLAGVVGQGGADSGAAVAAAGGEPHHGHHLAGAGERPNAGQGHHRQDAGPTPHEVAHCLAAACATPALAVTLAELPVPASVARHQPVAEPTAPHAPRVAPEPPPPRA